jgi:hypothetical protein
VFLEFSERTRKDESDSYMRTLTGRSVLFTMKTNTDTLQGKCISLDNTFHTAGKASVVDKQKTRSKIMKGGLLTAINEISETLSWVCSLLPAKFRILRRNHSVCV